MSCGTFDLRVYEGCPDADQDAVCDDVDLCVGDNAIGDLDGDGSCNDRDLCTGYDPSGDSDATAPHSPAR